MTKTKAKKLAAKICDDLFRNGNGDIADRLVLTSPDGRDLGGWSRLAVEPRIVRILEGRKDGEA